MGNRCCFSLLLGALCAFSFNAFSYIPDPDLPDRSVKTECLSIQQGKKYGCARLPYKDAQCSEGQLAFIYGSCMVNEDFKMIPGIDQPKFKVTAKIMKEYTATQIAQNLIYRFYLLYEAPYLQKKDFINPVYLFHQRIDIQIAFDFQYLDSIAEKGFLNQHDLLQSHGSLDPSGRLEKEKDMLNFNIDYKVPLAKKILPKYSFATPTQAKDLQIRSSGYAAQYGDVIANLNDNVRSRSTITTYDSLSMSYESTHPSYIHTLYWLENTHDFVPTIGSYWETQIWGDLSFKDAKYLLVNCYENTVPKEKIQYLANKSKLKVYSCKLNNKDPSHPHYVKVDLLASPKN